MGEKKGTFMQKPILIVTLGYIIGIIMGLYCKISIALLYPIVIIIYLYIKKHNNIIKYARIFNIKNIIIVIMISAFISNTIVLNLNNRYNKKYENITKANFIATIVSDKYEKEYGVQYKIKVQSVENNKTFNNTYLLLNTNDKNNLQYGDKISFLGEYKSPQEQRNYGGFSYKEYLKSSGIYGNVNTKSVTKIKQEVNHIEKIASNIRVFIKKNVRNNIQDKDKQKLILGILLGDNELSDEIKQNFIASGLSHILAVSGMHVSFVILGITLILEKLKTPKKITNFFTICFLILFIFLTNKTVSVTRACIMSILSLIAPLVNRKSDIITNLSIAILVILIINPFSIKSTSFILSFMATIGIIYVYPLIYKNPNNVDNKEEANVIKTLYDKVKQIICISISASIATLPISIILFNEISTVFIFSNLLVSFIIGGIILLGFISVLIPIKVVYVILNILLELILNIVNMFSNLPFSKLILVTPNVITIIIYYLLIIVFAYLKILRKKQQKRRIEKYILTNVNKFKNLVLEKAKIIICIVITIVIGIQSIKYNTGILKIHFIDVSQGDASLVITPNNKTILIDGGGNKNSDIGKKTLLPYLLDRKVNRIDYLIISHFDIDHCRLYPNNFRKYKS